MYISHVCCLLFSMVSLQTEYDIHSKDNLVEDMPIPDDNIQAIETDFTLSARLQLACMLAFAYIWSLGAFVPFKYVYRSQNN